MYILTAGTRLGRFILINILGRGGMGEVWRAQDPRLSREVAIKVLPAELSKDPESRARFERESKVLAALNHPNIAQIYEAGEENAIGVANLPPDEKISFLVMELVEGKSLSDILQATRVPPLAAVRISKQIATALAAAHKAGIIHRDLKPANIMITSRNQAKVLDFGLARPMTPIVGLAGVNVPEVTVPGMVMGTAAYLSPELIKGSPADVRSDIWAFGCVLYQMLSGHRPFVSDSVPEMLAGILRDEPAELHKLNSDVPGALSALVERCLAKDPQKRPQSAMELAYGLKELANQMRGSVRNPAEIKAPAPGFAAESHAAPSPVHVDTINRYLKTLNAMYPLLNAYPGGASFTEFSHLGVKMGLILAPRPKDQVDLLAIIAPLLPLPGGDTTGLYKRLLVLSNGHTDVAQFAIDERLKLVNLTCVRTCTLLDYGEFQYTLDTVARVATQLRPLLTQQFGVR